MNKRDFYSKFFISQVDTKLLSKTYADYAKNMAEKASNRVAYITDFDDNFNISDLKINTSSMMIIPCLSEDNGYNSCSVKISDLKNSLQQAMISNEEVFIITDTTGQQKEVNVDSLSTFLTNAVSQLQITQFAYNSLDMEDSGSYFMNTLQGLNVQIDNFGSDFKALVQTIHETVSTKELDVIDKISQLANFFGFSAANSDANILMSNDFDVTQYTGINPVQAWAAGIEINLSSLTGIADAYIKIGKKVWSTVGKIVGAVFKTATKYISETFVDPIDYQVDGDYIGYFSTPAKVVVNADFNINNPPMNTTAENTGYGLDAFRRFMDKEGNFSPYFINCHSVLYRIMKYNDDIYYERYVRPIDYKALYKDLSSIDYSTIDGCYTLFETLERNDYLLPASASELEVYRGILFSYALSSIWSFCIYSALLNDVGADFGRADGDFFSNTTANSALYGFSTLVDQVKTGLKWCIDNTGSEIPTVPTIVGLIRNELLVVEVSNIDFIKLLTRSVYFDGNEERNVDASNIYNYGDSQINGYTCISKKYVDPGYASASNMLMFHYPITFLGLKQSIAELYEPTYGLVYMPYLHGTKFDPNINTVVKTDEMNAQAIENLYKGLLIATAVVAAFIVSKKVISGFKSSIIANTALYNRKSVQLAAALSKGNTDLSNQLTSEMKSLMKKNKLKSAALGVFGISVSDTISQLTDTSVSLNESFTKSLSTSSDLLDNSINNVSDKINEIQSLIH